MIIIIIIIIISIIISITIIYSIIQKTNTLNIERKSNANGKKNSLVSSIIVVS